MEATWRSRWETTPWPMLRAWAVGIVLSAAVVAGLGLPEQAAEAQDGVRPDDSGRIFVLQRKPFLRKGRLELVPHFGMTVNDSLIRQYDGGGQLVFHFTEDFWFGGTFSWFDFGELGGVTEDYFEVLEKTQSIPDVVEMSWYAGADFGYVPVSGKFALFNSGIIYYDLSLFVGGGYATYLSGGAGGETGAPAGSIGIQPRIFLTRWLALTGQVRDTIFLASLKSGSGTEDSLTHVVTVTGGLSIFIPFGFEYTQAR